MTNKCKCRKDVMVVVIDSSTPYGGTFCDFLKELSPEKRCKYNYVPFYANTSTEAWVDKLKCKLQQLCKKNCKKPNVLSTLFDTNLEMLLARVQACVNCFLLTHSTYEVNSVFKCFRTLPAGPLDKRTNEYYTNDGTINTIVVDGRRDANYTNSVTSNMAEGENVQVVKKINTPTSRTFIGWHTNPGWDILGVTRDKLDKAATIGDGALMELAKANGGKVSVENIKGSNYAKFRSPSTEGYLYAKLYSNQKYTADQNLKILAAYAGLFGPMFCHITQCVPDENLFLYDQARSAAQKYDFFNLPFDIFW